MKKILLVLIAICLLSGCQNKSGGKDDEKYTKYISYYKNILDNDKFAEKSDTFDLTAQVSKIAEGDYRYYVIVDAPRIAMYDVEMLVTVDGVSYVDSATMAPSVGIYEDEIINLIPYQSYVEGNYMKGIVANGECTQSPVVLKILVSYKDGKGASHKEFFKIRVGLDGIEYQETEDHEGNASDDLQEDEQL